MNTTVFINSGWCLVTGAGWGAVCCKYHASTFRMSLSRDVIFVCQVCQNNSLTCIMQVCAAIYFRCFTSDVLPAAHMIRWQINERGLLRRCFFSPRVFFPGNFTESSIKEPSVRVTWRDLWRSVSKKIPPSTSFDILNDIHLEGDILWGWITWWITWRITSLIITVTCLHENGGCSLIKD